jgi:glycosyltransferase involved in cell wall biosynthesis
MYWEQVAVPQALRRGKFDLYHAPAEHGVPLVHPCPAILTVHSVTEHSYVDLVRSGQLTGPVAKYLGYEARPYRWTLANLYWRSQVLRASHILAPSDFARGEIIKFLHVAPDRVTTTHLAVHSQFCKPPRSQPERAAVLQRLGVRTPYILYVGGFEPHKNVSGLLETFSLVRTRQAHLSLVVVGSKGIPPGLADDAAVRFLADVTDDLNDLYDGAELFVSMSWRETFCLPALEAMTRGVPAVVSSWGATPEVVGDSGCLVDPRFPEGAAEAINTLLNRSDRDQLAAAARVAAAKFDWNRTARQTLQVYRDSIAGTSSSAN